MTQVISKWFKETDIGVIPEDWEVIELWKIGELKNGINYNRSAIWEWLKVISVKQLFRWEFVSFLDLDSVKKEKISNYSSYIVKNWDLLFARSSIKREGSGKLAIVKWLNNDYTVFSWFIIRFRNESSNDNMYLNYLLRSPIYRELFPRIWVWTTITNLTQGILKNVPIILPPLSQQKAIAEILSSLDDKIELLGKQNKTLENIGQSIFKSWFVDFEGFENDLVESEMGMIPRGWKVGEVGDYAKIKSWFAFKSADFSSEWINIIKIKNITDSWVDLINSDYVIESNLPDRAFEFKLEQWDILVAMSWNTTWKIAMMQKFDWQFLLNQRAWKFFMKNKRDTWFIYFYLKTNNIWELILQTAYWSAQPNIAWKDIERFDIIIPEDSELERFENISNNLVGKININIYQIKNLSNLRDSLLLRLMNGKVRV